jgi:hypothetical protein
MGPIISDGYGLPVYAMPSAGCKAATPQPTVYGVYCRRAPDPAEEGRDQSGLAGGVD